MSHYSRVPARAGSERGLSKSLIRCALQSDLRMRLFVSGSAAAGWETKARWTDHGSCPIFVISSFFVLDGWSNSCEFKNWLETRAHLRC